MKNKDVPVGPRKTDFFHEGIALLIILLRIDKSADCRQTLLLCLDLQKLYGQL